MVCVGETLAEREAGKTFEVVKRQLQTVIDQVGIEQFGLGVVAYEPVWAIGTGKTATPEQVQEVHAEIRKFTACKSSQVADGLKVLYGGSVKADNASVLMQLPDVDGALVGGASLKASDFLPIINSCGA